MYVTSHKQNPVTTIAIFNNPRGEVKRWTQFLVLQKRKQRFRDGPPPTSAKGRMQSRTPSSVMLPSIQFLWGNVIKGTLKPQAFWRLINTFIKNPSQVNFHFWYIFSQLRVLKPGRVTLNHCSDKCDTFTFWAKMSTKVISTQQNRALQGMRGLSEVQGQPSSIYA